jgi:hypothetical protein
MSQLPHSLQKSAKFANCSSRPIAIVPSVRAAQPAPSGRTLTTACVVGGTAKVKLASLGHTGTHFLQVTQSNSARCVPSLRGGFLLAA